MAFPDGLAPGLILAGLAVVALSAFWPRVRVLAARNPWFVPLAVALLVIDLDFRGAMASGWSRYLAVAATVNVAFLLRERHVRRAAGLRAVTVVFAAYAVVGSAVGAVMFDTQTGALPLAAPLLVLAVGWTRVGPYSTLGEPLRVIAVLGICFEGLMALQRLGYLETSTLSEYNHERAFIVVLAIGSSLAARSILLSSASIGLAVWVFLLYPAATLLVALAAAGATAVMVRAFSSRLLATATLVRWGILIGSGVGVFWASQHVARLLSLPAAYFEAVGKTDNGATRSELYDAALSRLSDHPLFSEFFTGDVTVVITRSGQRGVELPVHNDYLSLALGGGFVAVVMFLVVTGWVNNLALRAAAAAQAAERVDVRRTITTLLAGVNAAAFSSLANPVLMIPATGAAAYAVMLAVVSVSTAELAPDPAQGSRDLRGSRVGTPTHGRWVHRNVREADHPVAGIRRARRSGAFPPRRSGHVLPSSRPLSPNSE